MKQPHCRFSGRPLKHTLVDLGMSPLAESYVRPENVHKKENFYPLHVWVSEEDFLVQLEEFESPDHIFTEYAYFSSYSESWLRHAKAYTDLVTPRFGLNAQSQVIEIASNDGYLLQYFKEKGIPVLGVEPAANIAKVARDKKGIPSVVKFFGVKTAKELVADGYRADLLLGNNVLAHVPDINDFVAGMKIVLKPDGVITVEFPHVLNLIELNQFDTIYHEHFSYLSFFTTERIFAKHGLTLFDVDEVPTHGGSLRIYARHTESSRHPVAPRVAALRDKEIRAGLTKMETYTQFGERAKATKRKFLRFLIDAKEQGKSIVGYGAAAKGTTLVNYCGVREDFIDYLVDRNPYKHGLYSPGVHIPIHPPEKVFETKPDYLLILPWNIADEIVKQMDGIRKWGGKFVVPIPEVRVLE